LTDRHEIWHGDAVRASWAFWPLKFRKFKILKMVTAAILKIEKPRYRSIITDHRQICMMTHFDHFRLIDR